MMLWPISVLVYRGGMSVAADATSRRATLGLIVARSDDQLFGLTVATAVPAGHKSHALSGERRLVLGRSVALDHPAEIPQSTDALITALPIPAKGFVEQILGQLEAPEAVGSIFDHAAKWLILARDSGRARLGRAVAAGAAFTIDLPGQEAVEFSGAIRVDCGTTAAVSIRPGDAGAAVLTEDGVLIGLLLGTAGNHAFVAPLDLVLPRNGFRPIQREDIMRREAERAAVNRQAAADREQSPPPRSQAELELTVPRMSSRERFQTSNVHDFLKKYEGSSA